MKAKKPNPAEVHAAHPVALAVLPLKTQAVERAETHAREHVARSLDELREADWNLETVAPPPGPFESDIKASVMRMRRQFFERITTNDQPRRDALAKTLGFVSGYSVGVPMIVKRHPASEARYIEHCKQRAAAQYEAFCWKLCDKVGACDRASIWGEHVWSFSILTVHKGETVEKWKTQTIENRSKLGLVFNQWPSRQIKA